MATVPRDTDGRLTRTEVFTLAAFATAGAAVALLEAFGPLA